MIILSVGLRNRKIKELKFGVSFFLPFLPSTSIMNYITEKNPLSKTLCELGMSL